MIYFSLYILFGRFWSVEYPDMSVIRIPDFEDHHIRVFGTADDPWFCGKDVAEVLRYKNTMKALLDHVHPEDKKPFHELYQVTKERPIDSSDEKEAQQQVVQHVVQAMTAIYINESGLFSLLMKSTLPVAKKFQRWVTKEVLPSIRKTGSYQLEERNGKLQRELQERNEELQRKLEASQKALDVHVYSMKKFAKTDPFFILSKPSYADLGIYKVATTVEMEVTGFPADARRVSHLVVYPVGESVSVLMEFRVNDAKLVTKRIHENLAKIRWFNHTDIFVAPFRALVRICQSMVDSDGNFNDVWNETVEEINHLRITGAPKECWTDGIDKSRFAALPAPENTTALIESAPIDEEKELMTLKDAESNTKEFIVDDLDDEEVKTTGPDTTDSVSIVDDLDLDDEFIVDDLNLDDEEVKTTGPDTTDSVSIVDDLDLDDEVLVDDLDLDDEVIVDDLNLEDGEAKVPVLPEDLEIKNPEILPDAEEKDDYKIPEDIQNAPQEERDRFLTRCLEEQKRTTARSPDGRFVIMWSAFQEVIRTTLRVAKRNFRSSYWWPHVREVCQRDNSVDIKYRTPRNN
jgi:prophage antirepressor-like protein